MGVLVGAPSYRQQHDNLRHSDCIDVEYEDVTTDPEEGRRQIEAMKPEPLKVGDRVRLKAGGERVMTVVALEDYDNQAVCEWNWPGDICEHKDTFSVRSLVLVQSD